VANPTSGPAEIDIPASVRADYPLVRNFLRRLDLEATTEAQEGGDETVLQIINSILAAETEEELFKAQEAGVLSAKDFVNQPFRLKSENVSWRRSNIESSALPFFAIMKILDLEDGEEKMLACGGATFMVVLDKLISFGSLDRPEDSDQGRSLQITAKRTSRGYDVLLLKPFNMNGARKTDGAST